MTSPNQRIIRDVRSALARRQIEVSNARSHAASALRSQLREPLTVLLLNCDLLPETATLELSARSKIETIHEMGRQLADHLEVSDMAALRA